MNAKTYKLCTLATVFLLGALVAVSVAMEASIFLPLGGVVAALLLLRFCRRFTKETVADERTRLIYEKAAAIAFRVFSFGMAILALVVAMLRTRLPPEFSIVGQTAGYSVCVLMLIHLAFYYYYQHKL